MVRGPRRESAAADGGARVPQHTTRWRTQDAAFHAAATTGWLPWHIEALIAGGLALPFAALARRSHLARSGTTPADAEPITLRYYVAAALVGLSLFVALAGLLLLPWRSRIAQPPLVQHVAAVAVEVVIVLVAGVVWRGLRRGSPLALRTVAVVLIVEPLYRLAAALADAPWLDPNARAALGVNAVIAVPFLMVGLALLAPRLRRAASVAC